MKAPSKCYVVYEGRRPRIYTSWHDCYIQANGLQGNSYKSYKSENEAVKAYEAYTARKVVAVYDKKLETVEIVQTEGIQTEMMKTNNGVQTEVMKADKGVQTDFNRNTDYMLVIICALVACIVGIIFVNL